MFIKWDQLKPYKIGDIIDLYIAGNNTVKCRMKITAVVKDWYFKAKLIN